MFNVSNFLRHHRVVFFYVFLILMSNDVKAQAPIFEEEGLEFTTTSSIIFTCVMQSPQDYDSLIESLQKDGLLYSTQRDDSKNEVVVIVGETLDASKYIHIHDSDGNFKVNVPWVIQWKYRSGKFQQVDLYLYSSSKKDLIKLRKSFVYDFTNSSPVKLWFDTVEKVKDEEYEMWRAYGDDVECEILGPLSFKEINAPTFHGLNFMLDLTLWF